MPTNVSRGATRHALVLVLMAFAFLVVAVLPGLGQVGDRIGTVKAVSGDVRIVRGGLELAALSGEPLIEGDVILTGEDSAIGLTFIDKSRMSLGPNSTLELAKFVYNAKGGERRFDSRLSRGSMTAASGDIAKWKPLAMRVMTPTMVLGVKGTKFVVRADASE